MRFSFMLLLTFTIFFSISDAIGKYSPPGREITITETETAQHVYSKGFARNVMRDGKNAVKLWNRELIENDSPGVGISNKGTFMEPVYGSSMIKKILIINDPRCSEVSVVFNIIRRGTQKYPITVSVNGTKTSMKRENCCGGVYVPIDPSWLRKGKNEIILSCSEAKTPEDGWYVLLARADEYMAGGWDIKKGSYSYIPYQCDGIEAMFANVTEKKLSKLYPEDIGNYSFLSIDGGENWSVKGKGLTKQALEALETDFVFEPEKGGVPGEYSVRVNMRQHVSKGVLVSTVIDLWAEPEKKETIIPFTYVDKMNISFNGVTPPGTEIIWQIRGGVTFDPLKSSDWTEWVTLSTAERADVNPQKRVALPSSHWDPERSLTLPHVRYIQWRAVLKTSDPLVSPSVESVQIKRVVRRRMEAPPNIITQSFHNPEILYSSTGFDYQSSDEPMNQIIINHDDLDKLVENASTEFDAIIRMLDYASRRWVYGGPILEYPKLNTIDTAERAHSLGDGGMCIQYAEYLIHMLAAMGFHARHVNIRSHEVVEVWSNDFDKWVYLDPTQGVDLYMYNKKTGVPLSLYDMHRIFYNCYEVTKPIDWMKTPQVEMKDDVTIDDLPADFSTTDPRVALSHKDWVGYHANTLFMRMMPRNSFSSSSIPEPLQIGVNGIWPWDGYLNWYDELAPPMLQYSNHTDRRCDFWPTLNRVRYEAVPEINGDAVFIRMATFTPSFETFQIRVDGKMWEDSDDSFVWRMHSGKNLLEMRAKSGFGVYGHPSLIEVNFVSKPIPKPVNFGSME